MKPLLSSTPAQGSLDGRGAGDHDQPYRFGQLPRAVAPFPFSTREFARLLVIKSRIRSSWQATSDHPEAA